MDKTKLIRLSWFAYFVVLSTWAILSYFSFNKIWASGELFAQSNGKDSVQVTDFTTFYAAGEMAREALFGRSELYNTEKLRTKINLLIAPIYMPEKLAMQYPPPYLLFLTLLPVLPLPYSWIGWSIFSACALALAIAIFTIPDAGRPEKAISIAYGLAWFPTFWCCWVGQNSQVVLFCLALILYLLRKEKYLFAGLASALGLFKIQYFPMIAVVGLVLGRWRYAGGVAGGCAVLFAFSIGVFGWTNVRSFFDAVLGQEGTSVGTVAHMMDSVRGVLSVFCASYLSQNLILLLSAVVLLIALAATAWLWLTLYRDLKSKNMPAFELCTSFTIILMLATSLHCHTQDYVLLLLAGINIFFANRRMTKQANPNKALKIAIDVSLLFVLPLVSWLYALKFVSIICYIVKPLMVASLLLMIMEFILVAQQTRVEK